MSEETAFIIAYPRGDATLGRYRFEVYSAGAGDTPTVCGSDMCSVIPSGQRWGCDNFTRRDFALAAVRAAFPTVEALEYDEPPSTMLHGRLPDAITVRVSLDRDTLELRRRIAAAEHELDRLTGARVVTLVP